MTSLVASASLREHFLQCSQHRKDSLRIQLANRFNQALSIDRPQLIKGDKACAPLEPAPRPPWVRATAGGHRRHDHRPEMLVQFVRRYDEAGSRFLDFAA